MAALPKSVFIREVGVREGFQTLDQVYPTERKLALIQALASSGLKEIEVTSFVRGDLLPQMADAEEIAAKLTPVAGVKYSGLYLNRQGFLRAEECPKLTNQGWISVAASAEFLKRNSNTILKQIFSELPEWVATFQSRGKKCYGLMISTAFGCNYQGQVSKQVVINIISEITSRLEDLGESITEISLADTMGHGSPKSVRELVELVRTTFPDLTISLHLHDTRGTGMANVYAGLEVGIDRFDSSIGGLGGCPFAKGAAGNVPTEDVAYLCAELGIDTGLELDRLVAAAKLAESIVGFKLPGKYYRSFGG